MPIVKVTDSLREIIKSERKKRNLRGDVLSKNIGKSASYISLLERGNIDTIELSLFHNLFKNIIVELPEENFYDYLNNILMGTSVKYTREEIEHEQWMKSFEIQYRQFPITEELINYISTALNNLNSSITPEKLVLEINKNKGLDDIDKTKLKPNIADVRFDEDGNVAYSIMFDLPLDFISNILSKKTETINYINMLGILYNIHLLDGMNSNDSTILSERILKENNFITVKERNKKLINRLAEKKKQIEKSGKNEQINLIELLDSDTEKEYQKNYEAVKEHIRWLKNQNILYANKTMTSFKRNLDEEPSITFAVLNKCFYNLKDLSIDEKKDFLLKLNSLINTYSKKEINILSLEDSER